MAALEPEREVLHRRAGRYQSVEADDQYHRALQSVPDIQQRGRQLRDSDAVRVDNHVDHDFDHFVHHDNNYDSDDKRRAMPGLRKLHGHLQLRDFNVRDGLRINSILLSEQEVRRGAVVLHQSRELHVRLRGNDHDHNRIHDT